MNNTNNKSVNRTNHTNETPYNYRPIKILNRKFHTASDGVRYVLTHNKVAKRSHTEIAKMCGVTQPCVSQLATQLLQ